jgi:hypothetical protein
MTRWFTVEETEGLNPELVRRLDEARSIAKVPFEITSGIRLSPPGKPKSHDRGNAVDIRCSTGYRRMKIISGALLAGFRRIGVYDKHIHLDVDEKSPQDVMWWGVSKP